MKNNLSTRPEARPGTQPAGRTVTRPSTSPSTRSSARQAPRDLSDHGPVALPGRLQVKWINGRNGEFAVGQLLTSLGEFRVKESLLDQFDEGTYEGTFWISRIFSKSYEYRGNITIETRAVLADLQIEEESKQPAEQEPPELDPIDEPPPAPTPPPLRIVVPPRRPPVPSQAVRKQLPGPQDLEPEDLELFGDEIAELLRQQGTVKLDPSIDRARLRTQRKRLGELGYAFDSRTQTFSHAGQASA